LSKLSNKLHAIGLGLAVADGVGVAVGVTVAVGVGPSKKPRIWKTWSGQTWSVMQTFFRFQVRQPVA